MNRRELASVLAALRFWQRVGPRLDQTVLSEGGRTVGPPELEIATDSGIEALSAGEIDDLVERLNGASPEIAATDVENATKAAQSAAFLCGDLTQLVRSCNPLLSDVALAELEIASKLRIRLERLQSNVETMAG